MELGWSHREGQAVSPLKSKLGVLFGSISLPPAWRSGSNLEELISGRDGSHDTGDPRLIKSCAWEQNQGAWERGTGGETRQRNCLPASSFTGQIKTTAEQVIKQEIMNSIILFSVEGLLVRCAEWAAWGAGTVAGTV